MIPVAPIEELRKSDKETSAAKGEINLIKEAANLLFHNISFTGKILIAVGNGNNGADGLALSLLLKENNYDVQGIGFGVPGMVDNKKGLRSQAFF